MCTNKKIALLIIGIMFIIFGTYAILNPAGISLSNLEKSYEVVDLIREWGIFSAVIGYMLLFPDMTNDILAGCFISSIIGHLSIVKKKGWTTHHKQSIGINTIALLLSMI